MENGAQIHPKQHNVCVCVGGGRFLNRILKMLMRGMYQPCIWREPKMNSLFMTANVNNTDDALQDDNVGPSSKWHSWFLIVDPGGLSSTARLAHAPISVGKWSNFWSKQKSNNLSSAQPIEGQLNPSTKRQEKDKMGEEKEEKWQWSCGSRVYTGRIRTKAFPAPA